jgi:hypothetical protein
LGEEGKKLLEIIERNDPPAKAPDPSLLESVLAKNNGLAPPARKRGVKQAMIDYAKSPKYDDYATPDYAVRPLLKYIPRGWKIWEPTDSDGKSRIAALLRENGNKVISTGKKQLDFTRDAPEFSFDCIITNPPYSWKDEFIRLCLAYRKPFALLLPLTALEGVARGAMFRRMGTKLGVLVLDRRVEFAGGSVWFNASWFCFGVLPRQLIFAEMEKTA